MYPSKWRGADCVAAYYVGYDSSMHAGADKVEGLVGMRHFKWRISVFFKARAIPLDLHVSLQFCLILEYLYPNNFDWNTQLHTPTTN